MKHFSQTAQHAYKAGSGFIGKYQKLIRDVVIPYQYEILADQVEGVSKSHVIQNFINAGASLHGGDIGDGYYGMIFQDSDLAKWLEATAYSLANCPDPELEATVDQVVDYVANAQDTDGYLNTAFTIHNRDRRWLNLMEGHELYCAGHMMEAACAYYEATGKDKLLHVMERNAECIYRHFIEEKHEGFPGHPEIELALLKMYRLTGNKRYLELSKHFVDVRGVDPDFYKKECANRNWYIWNPEPSSPEYSQTYKPVREQSDAVGHSVRAAYLYTAMADLASETEDEELLEACKRIWNSIVNKRMYITGGIGSSYHGEAFTVDYDLPNDTVYAETCASIALMFFAGRMLEIDVDRQYADVMERAFYNTVLAGMQLDGKRFFYVNPLEVVPGISGVSPTHRHVLPQRPGWYDCACCPPNVSRTVSSFGKYAYSENTNTACCHLYADGEVHFANGLVLSCRTDYPYGFTVDWRVLAGNKELAIRIPGWSKTYALTLNGQPADHHLDRGYAYLSVQQGDEIRLVLDDSPYYVYGSSKVPQLSGKVSLGRGPLVYCFEGIDNGDDVLSLAIDDKSCPAVNTFDPNLLSGIVTLTVDAVRYADNDSLYSSTAPQEIPCKAVAVPYHVWGNRGVGQMRVWMVRK